MEQICHYYCAYGLTIASEMPIAGARLLSDFDPQSVDLRIVFADARLDNPQQTHGLYARRDAKILFSAPDVARYLLLDNQVMQIAPMGADMAVVAELLIATALPMWLWSRGDFVLHAAGVVMPSGQVLAIAGASGTGKSYLLHRLLQRGAKILGDDTLRIVFADGAVIAAGLTAGYFLGLSKQNQRVMIDVSEEFQVESSRLDVMVVLQESEIPMSRLLGAEAMQAVLQNRHRPKIPHILARDGDVLAQVAVLCQRLPIYAGDRDADALMEMIESLHG